MRMVMCRKYGREMPGLVQAPYPGDKGREIYETVSLQAWQEWLRQQTMLINEKHLSLASAEHREYLQGQMERFLDGKEHDVAEGYVPPSED